MKKYGLFINIIKDILQLVTTLRPASPGFATWRIGGFAILATFCQFGDFGNFLAIFLAQFDLWTVCDNSLHAVTFFDWSSGLGGDRSGHLTHTAVTQSSVLILVRYNACP